MEQDSRFEECVTLQAPCFVVVTRTVSPVRIYSPVHSVPALRICHARVGIQLSAPGLRCVSSAQDILRRLCTLCLRCDFTAQCVLCQRPALAGLK